MSRVAKVIKCKEEDVNILKSVINNPLSSEMLRKKARAILLAHSGKESKAIALELNTREMSVCQWRNRYLQLGISGLYSAERSGRRGNKNPNVRKLIAEKVRSIAESDWTLETLATEFHTSEDTVRRALKDAHIEIPGTHGRKIGTASLSDTRSVFVAGLYLSDSEKAIILKSDPPTLGTSQSGVIFTKNSKNAKAIELNAELGKPVKVIDALKSLIDNGTESFGGRIINVGEFVNSLSSSLCKTTKSKIHIIIQRKEQSQQINLRYPNVSTTIVYDNNSWINSVRNWLQPLSDESEEITRVIETYIAKGTSGKEPFIWSSECNNIAEETKVISDTVEESETFVNNRMTVSIKFESHDGIAKDFNFVFNDFIPSLSEISFETPLSYASSLGQVERGTSSALNDVTRVVVQDFMNEANKKKRVATHQNVKQRP